MVGIRCSRGEVSAESSVEAARRGRRAWISSGADDEGPEWSEGVQSVQNLPSYSFQDAAASSHNDQGDAENVGGRCTDNGCCDRSAKIDVDWWQETKIEDWVTEKKDEEQRLNVRIGNDDRAAADEGRAKATATAKAQAERQKVKSNQGESEDAKGRHRRRRGDDKLMTMSRSMTMTTMTTSGQSLVRNCWAAGWTKPTWPGRDDNVKEDSRETYHDFRRGRPEGQERAGAPAVAKRWRGAGLGDGSRRRRVCVWRQSTVLTDFGGSRSGSNGSSLSEGLQRGGH